MGSEESDAEDEIHESEESDAEDEIHESEESDAEFLNECGEVDEEIRALRRKCPCVVWFERLVWLGRLCGVVLLFKLQTLVFRLWCSDFGVQTLVFRLWYSDFLC